MSLSVAEIREQFPAVHQKVRGQDLIYFDSAATSLKPKSVIEATEKYYALETANIHRGAHFLADRATGKYEATRTHVAKFIGAADSSEIIFTKGTTESINLVAQSYARKNLKSGDEILLTELEHHANIVPWHLLASDTGVVVKFVPILDSGELDFEAFKKLLTAKTKIVSITHCSNVLGTVIDIKKVTQAAHAVGAVVVVDAAQSATFLPIDVQDLNCDFLAFSAHKLFGPYGVGILYGKKDLLQAMPPWQGGGAIIDRVRKTGTTFLDAPQRFEPGTPNIGGVIAFLPALELIEKIGFENIQKHEKQLRVAALKILKDVGATVYGESPTAAHVISFNMPGAHASDVGNILDQQGVAVRTGHHCAQILMERLGVTGTIRISFSIYNTVEEVERFGAALKKAKEFF
jgi:cysteine desulfurase / selenocysteine lyase